jgi:hypothetical protein
MKDLLRIAFKLDKSGNYNLSDKLYKIAQAGYYNLGSKPIIDQNFYQLPMSFKLRKQQELNFAVQQFIAKQRNLQERFDTRKITREQYSKEVNANGIELESLKSQGKIIDDFLKNYQYYAQNEQQSEQQGEQQGENLISNSPEEFAKKLIDFKEENNLSSLVQAFDMYARSGAMYGNNPLSRDARLQKLYQRILQTPRFINEIEIVRELRSIIMGDE